MKYGSSISPGWRMSLSPAVETEHRSRMSIGFLLRSVLASYLQDDIKGEFMWLNGSYGPLEDELR